MSGEDEDKDKDGGTEVLLEFQRVGNAIKVTAVDPETLVEVSIVGDPKAGEAALTRNVIRKLEYVLNKRGHREG